VPIRIFKVNSYGAPPYPELVLTTSRKTLERDPALVRSVVAATRRGYAFAASDPSAALDDLLAADPALDRGEQAAQLHVLLPDLDPKPFHLPVLRRWATWDLQHGLLNRPLDVERAFPVG
jgi:ABC-type nitrate/sulfonate/bicarbonate transport system substrate-binding protein